MFVLCDYFLSLEDKEGCLRRDIISTMITFHDIDEIETGDVLGYLKTDAERDAEAAAMRRVIASVPENLKLVLLNAINEYEQQISREAKFVKALDKLEPIVHLYNEKGKRTIHTNKTTVENSYGIKIPYVTEFPYMLQFLVVTHDHLKQQGFFFTA
jgi:5'-deoxynucleotidase YfbR-like HD superfamily hydrolase